MSARDEHLFATLAAARELDNLTTAIEQVMQRASTAVGSVEAVVEGSEHTYANAARNDAYATFQSLADARNTAKHCHETLSTMALTL